MKGLAGALRRNPVRLYLYGVLVAGEAVAVAYGIVSNELGLLWLGLGAAILLVPATEAARAKVTPLEAPHTAAGEPAVLLEVPTPPEELRDPPGGSWVK